MLLAMVGMAVGTGNIWRFPRMAASNGGGSFLVAWVVFLLMWSIPLLILEFGMGKGTRAGPIGAFVKTLGPKFGWMGAWIAFTACGIMFYYSVVMGWTLQFFGASITGAIPSDPPEGFWEGYAASPSALLTHAIAMGMAVFVVSKGVRGIETTARILIPSLVILVVVLALRAVTLPGASEGLAFLFTPDWGALASPTIWLEALTQNAWDTGAGWGLVLCYAIYMRTRADTALNAFVIGFGNNTMSLLAGIMVLCTVFSVRPDAVNEIVGAGNEGLTFIWVPQLFDTLPGGQFFMVIFFLALVFAAWSSLIAMIELASRVLIDLGMGRSQAIAVVGIVGLLMGLPSALSMTFFQNQDFVWGVGLMLSGFFFAFAVVRYGVSDWRATFINTGHSDIHIGAWWDWAIRLVLVQAVVLIGWWMWQVRADGLAANLNPLEAFTMGTVALQWAVVLAILIGLNRWLVNRTTTYGEAFRKEPSGAGDGPIPPPPPGDRGGG
ncbi:MAG: sodium-dependent transporter [Gemmatimonadales bacterium]|nr:MAG: sodium-dependent transporter [Gemmatimonadales bacterium]